VSYNIRSVFNDEEQTNTFFEGEFWLAHGGQVFKDKEAPSHDREQ
jgi:hypothetical protein